jgi:hypothetical protein
VIDGVIANLDKKGYIYLDKYYERNIQPPVEDRARYELLIEQLERHNIAARKSPGEDLFVIKRGAKRVQAAGGFDEYLQHLIRQERKTEELVDLQIELTKSTIQSNKQNRLFAYINFGFLIANFIVALYTASHEKSEGDEAKVPEVEAEPNKVQNENDNVEGQVNIDSL